MVLAAAAALVVAVAVVVVILVRHHQQAALAELRPSGIPPSVPTSLANLMALSPVPARPASGFALTDQNGHPTQLSAFRGKVVVLAFMDTRRVNTCPLVAQEFIDARRDLGPTAGKVVFAAVNVNPHHARAADALAFSREHQLVTIPAWHFVTGPVLALRTVWRDYKHPGTGTRAQRRHRPHLSGLLHHPRRHRAVHRHSHGCQGAKRQGLLARRPAGRLGPRDRPRRQVPGQVNLWPGQA